MLKLVQIKSLSPREQTTSAYDGGEGYGLLRAFLQGKLKVVMDENRVPKLQFTRGRDGADRANDNTLFYSDLVDRSIRDCP